MRGLSRLGKPVECPGWCTSAAAGTDCALTANLPVVDPTKVQARVLLVRGKHDGVATVSDLFEFLLPTAEQRPQVREYTPGRRPFAHPRHPSGAFLHVTRALPRQAAGVAI
jgi:hypothetical protein